MRDLKSIIAATAFAFLSAAGILAQAPAANETQDDRYRIGYLDVIEVSVRKHPDLNRRVTVANDGTIDLFQLKEKVVAVCKTERELAADIVTAYKKDYLKNPEVNVVVAEQKSQPVSVIGSVEKAGTYFVGRRMQLIEILALAGGPNKESGTRVIVASTKNRSQCQMEETPPSNEDVKFQGFRLRDVQEGRSTMWIQPGDVVSVLPADPVYVYGNVIEQGQLLMKEPTTLQQAIAAAKGLKPATDKKSVRILRQVPNTEEREEIAVDLAAIEKGKAKDPFLQPNDIVAVSKDPVKNIVVGLGDAIKNGIPTIIARPY